MIRALRHTALWQLSIFVRRILFALETLKLERWRELYARIHEAQSGIEEGQ